MRPILSATFRPAPDQAPRGGVQSGFEPIAVLVDRIAMNSESCPMVPPGPNPITILADHRPGTRCRYYLHGQAEENPAPKGPAL